MPELPEVETIVRGLRENTVGNRIESLTELRNNTIIYHTNQCAEGLVFSSLSRRGKYILINLSDILTMVIHLRMTGKLVYTETEQLTPHTRAVIKFADRTMLQFEDIRTFGSIQIFEANDTDPAIKRLGPEPLTEDFNEKYLYKVLEKAKAPIKSILLNQEIIAGLGNIYVCEILYRTKIHPTLAGKELTRADIIRVITATKEVLAEAILHNGTSISDFRNIDDKPGEFQNFLRVYQKKECPLGHPTERIKIAGRSTYFCPVCQRLK
ncbi:MAG: bifunctional DNA-formamidopyrimidine glycosylase/DNA-(apurinic or apyrimidinic site) lyase [Candidatus Cloacimonetes bacterium]|nr:bifunctional DNA-formamidopyrimidine glycosylase/DNA-(apurinic or apyrimidinic site) lyase [Candidatus Cloacimonadota bacterium]